MAAKSVYVEFYTMGSFERDLRIEPRWWDPKVICDDPRFEKTNDTGSYFDWTAELTAAEFSALHESFRSAATTGYYDTAEWAAVIEPQIQVIDGVIAGALGTIKKVKVCVFESESGLGD